MAISVQTHDEAPLTLVVYSGHVTKADFQTFEAFFRRPDVFPLENAGILLIEKGTDFSGLAFKDVLHQAKALEKINLQHEANGNPPPDFVPLVITALTQRLLARLWGAATELAPKIKPTYPVCRTMKEAANMLSLPAAIIDDLENRRHFTPLKEPVAKPKAEVGLKAS